MLLGLLAFKPAWRWWGKIWPAERRDDYAGAMGYLAAQGVRAGLFALAFLPLAGPAALFTTVFRRAETANPKHRKEMSP